MSEAATLTPAVPRPPHITDAVFYDFDLFHDPGLLKDPHDRVLDMIKTAPPVFWTPRNGGHWMFMSHAANFKASRDPSMFTSQIIPKAQIDAIKASMPPGTPHLPSAVPIGMDPPEHTKYRAPLQQGFSPKAMLALKDSIRALAVELIEKIKPLGGVEFIETVAEPLPVQVFLKMFGLPLERQKEYRALVREHMASTSPDPKVTLTRLLTLTAIMRDTVLERKKHPQDDLISLLWQAGIDGKPTTLETMEDYCVVLFLAGLDTVMNGIGHQVRHLARNPDLQAELRANPKLIQDATEEILRRYTFTVPPRKVAKDMVFEGVTMKEGEMVMLFLPAADLDGKEYPHPERIELKRENNVHIAFGVGPHRCLGSHLARIELQALNEEILARLPPFRIDPKHPPKFKGGNVIGPETLHIRWD